MQQTKMSNKKSTYVLKDRFCPLKRLFTNKAKVINATKAIGARCCANTINNSQKNQSECNFSCYPSFLIRFKQQIEINNTTSITNPIWISPKCR